MYEAVDNVFSRRFHVGLEVDCVVVNYSEEPVFKCLSDETSFCTSMCVYSGSG